MAIQSQIWRSSAALVSFATGSAKAPIWRPNVFSSFYWRHAAVAEAVASRLLSLEAAKDHIRPPISEARSMARHALSTYETSSRVRAETRIPRV